MRRVAIFDLDKTLTRRPTFALWLAWWALHRAPWRLPLLALFGLLALGHPLGLASRGWLKVAGHALLLGRPRRQAVAAEASAFARWTLRANRLGPGLRAWEAERAAGSTMLIASASFDIYVNEIARLLNAQAVIATRSAWEGDRLAPRLDGDNCYGTEKARRIEGWLAEAGLVRSQTRIALYSDSAADLPALELADEPVAVRPDRRLRAIAAARGWRVLA
ncbi:MAG: HAD family hydrolase [Sphingomonadaceae bacterium]